MEYLAFSFALIMFLFLPLYRIQFLKIIKIETKLNIIQNLDIAIVTMFIWFEKAQKNVAKAR